MRKDIIEKKDSILEWINQNQSKSFISRKLKCKIDTLEKYLKVMNITYQGNQGLKKMKSLNKKHVSVYLFNGSNKSSHHLKLALFRDGIKDKICEKCGNTEWNGVEIPLHLHHIDGNNKNNELKNLLILCPNCHAQTDNYGTRNSIKYKKNKISLFVKKRKEKKKKIIIEHLCSCGKSIEKRSKCCPECNSKKQRKVQNRPNKEDLIIMIKDTSLEAVGRIYGVSGNAVKKWIK